MSANDPFRPAHREHLIHPVTLLVMASVITLLLYVMFPKESVFTASNVLDRPDAVTLEYLQLLLHSDPDNDEVRTHLVRQLSLAGRYQEALKVMAPLIDRPEALNDPEHYSLYLNLLAQDMFAQTRPAARYRAQRRLENALHRLMRSTWPADRIRATLMLTREWVSPAMQIDMLEWLLKKEPDTRRKKALHLDIAKLYQGLGRADQALRHLRLAYQLAENNEKPVMAVRMMQMALASGDPYQALILAPDLVRRHPRRVAVLDQAIDVARQNGRADLALRWQRQRYALTPENERLGWALFDAEIAAGNLNDALALVPRLEATANTATRIRKIAQAYSWSGRMQAAYDWWARYADLTGRDADWRRVWQMAIGLYRLPDARRILEDIEQTRALTAQERATLFGLYLDVGDTAAARRMLERAHQRAPANREIVTELYSLLIDLRDWASAAALLEDEARYGRLNAKQWVEWANLYWLQRDPEAAWRVLQTTPATQRTKEYWTLRLDLALYLEDFDAARQSLDALMADPQAVSSLPGDVLLTVANGLALTGQTEQAARLMYQFARTSGQPSVKLQAIALAIKGRLATLAARWLAETPLPPDPQERGLYWALKAQLADLQGRPERARNAWEQATIYAPENTAYREALLWALIRDADRAAPALRSYLDYYQRTGADDPRLWPLLAFGYMALGDPEQALLWFRLGLPAHQTDPDWLMGMAEAFRLGGYHDYAWRLRRYVYTLLQPELFRVSGDSERMALLLRLAREWGGQRQARAALNTPAGKHLATTDRLELLLEWALADGHRILAEAYYQQAVAQSLKLPGWQHLALALQHNDKTALQAILKKFSRLPLADRARAQQRLGRPGSGLAFGLARLTDTLDEDNLKALRALTASLRTGLERGIRVEAVQRSRDVLDLTEWGVTWSDVYAESAWGGQLWHYTLQPQNLMNDGSGDQTDLKLHWRPPGAALDWALGIALSDRNVRTVWGFTMSGARSLDEGLQYGWTLRYQVRPDVSGTTWAWGQESGLDGQLNWGLDSRTALSLTAGWRMIESVWGQLLGQGPTAAAGLTHNLFLNDPAWQLGADVQWYAFDGDPLADTRLVNLFSQTPSPDTVLPPRYGRVGLTTTWYHGQLHRIAHEVPSPRWHLGLNVGYQWVRQVVDYGIRAGLGWRIGGDDELALSFNWTSESAAGGQNLLLKISYNSYLGR